MYQNLRMLFLGLMTLSLFSCNSLYDGDFELEDTERTFAVPIAFGSLNIQDVIDRAEGDASIRIDGLGRITALYSGEILRDNASKIFPPVPGIFEFAIFDTIAELPLPVNGSYRIDKGIFDNTNIYFKFNHSEKEVIKVKMFIESVNNDGVVWKKDYTLDFTNDADGVIETSSSSLLNWVAFPVNNKIKFRYLAYKPNGDRIKMSYAAMRFDVLKFTYLDGYFGNHTFDIKGDIIKINLFDLWKSGGLEIEQPQITLDVDNAFGFPVRSKVNQLTVKTVGDKLFNVESEYINKGIDFDYPSINQVGQTKNTVFHFNAQNSNIGELFKDKVIQVIYDFDALANPDGDTGVKNFYTSDGFFSVKVNVELPMKIKANLFTIADTIDLDLSDYDAAKAVELKIKTANSFPMDMVVGLIFLDNSNNVLYTLAESEKIKVGSAPLNGGEKTTTKNTQEHVLNLDVDKFSSIKQAKKILVTGSFDTNIQSATPIWLYNDYGMDITIGAIVKIQ